MLGELFNDSVHTFQRPLFDNLAETFQSRFLLIASPFSKIFFITLTTKIKALAINVTNAFKSSRAQDQGTLPLTKINPNHFTPTPFYSITTL